MWYCIHNQLRDIYHPLRNLCNTLLVLEDNRSPCTFCHSQYESHCESSPPYVSKHPDQNQEYQESVLQEMVYGHQEHMECQNS